MALIRRLLPSDQAEVVEVYRDAVLSQASGLYSPQQIEAWAEHAARCPEVAEALRRGYGLASCGGPTGRSIEAFGLLDPLDRLSLLYCRGRSNRQGRGSALVRALERKASVSGCTALRTEASQLSRPLLEALNWQVEAEEQVLFAGVSFIRWRMIKTLK